MPVKILLRKSSLVDYPDCVSSVFFFSGCNLRCPWCHNRDLVLGNETESLITVEEGLAHLNKRKNHLGGVVLSGGEPCLWEGLPKLIEEIKKIPMSVKLDTNGTFPDMLEKLFQREETCPDYIALDMKIAPHRYKVLFPEKILRTPGLAGDRDSGKDCAIDPGEALIQSAALIRSSGIAHEFRSLALPSGYFTENDIEALAPLVDDGAPWYFRPFRGGNCISSAWNTRASAPTESLAEKARKLGKNGIFLEL